MIYKVFDEECRGNIGFLETQISMAMVEGKHEYLGKLLLEKLKTI